jgi:hypothetical protein
MNAFKKIGHVLLCASVICTGTIYGIRFQYQSFDLGNSPSLRLVIGEFVAIPLALLAILLIAELLVACALALLKKPGGMRCLMIAIISLAILGCPFVF